MKPELRLEQKLYLSPQIILNLRLLALPALELECVLREEMEKNPSLEEVPEAGEEFEEEVKKKGEERKDDEFDWTDLLPEGIQEGGSGFRGVTSTSDESYEFSLPAGRSPVEAVLEMVRARLKAEDLVYAEYILQNLDEDGFLLITKEELKENLGISDEKLAQILEVIQSIEPGGIASSNHQEAFLAQLKRLGWTNESLEYQIVSSFYESWLKLDFKTLARRLRVKVEFARRAVENLKVLEMRPLRLYDNLQANYIEPDFVLTIEGEKLVINFRDENIPNLRISPYYRDILRNPKAFSQEEVEFAREKVRSALLFIKAIEERKAILKRVVEYIVDKQKRFFWEGEAGLIPLTIKDCARDLGYHPSKIYRALQRKYLSTPTGIFPLKKFFARGLRPSFAEGMGEALRSREGVKVRIKELLAVEDPNSPLSDEEIARRLAKEGVSISRRTVVKYRQELKIPSSRQRQRSQEKF